ncbi:gastrula zinc finger protein XlCGF26.1-like isoform X8 [Onthophagus taurus]|uniref:gastrula zinc finger protein XlCGF26.1-like isoform X8 n=1 Tax=Onthophagus taurus TaxID=166361 RepID=UPI0039BDAF61
MMGTMSSIKEIMQFCRLCLVKDQVNVSIFEEHGDTRDVKRKISECLPVTVSEEDSLPKKICDGCLYKLELLYQFRTTCVSAEKQLQVWIAELNNSESKEDQDLKLQHSQTSVKEEIFDATDHPDNSEYVIEEQHISYEEGDIPYNESQDDNDDGDATNSSDDEPLAKRRKRFLEEQVQTDDTLKTADNKMAITKLEHESDDENVDDPEPNFVSVGTSDDQQPGPSGLNKMSATTTNAEMPSSPDQKFQPRTCTSCNRSYTTQSSFKTHKYRCPANPLITKVTEKMSCIRCGKTFLKKAAFSKHFRRCQRGRTIPCDVCQKLFKTVAERNTHKKRVHDAENCQKYPCDICDQTFRDKPTLTHHKKRHLNQYDFTCDECGEQFVVKSSFEYHILSKHKGVRHACKDCGKIFTTEWYLREHSVKHNDDYEQQYFSCSECEKKFMVKSSLNQHIKRVHCGKGLSICEICGKAVTSKTSLRDHIMIHTGEKPFKCEVCKKPFKTKNLLKIHVRTHTNSKPFVCNICEKAFTQRTSLVVHIRQHTGEKPYPCVVCNRRFYTSSSLKVHSKSHGVPLSDI